MSFDGERWCFLAQSLMAGIMMATTGVLLRKALTMLTGAITRSWAPVVVVGRPRTRWLIQ